VPKGLLCFERVIVVLLSVCYRDLAETALDGVRETLQPTLGQGWSHPDSINQVNGSN